MRRNSKKLAITLATLASVALVSGAVAMLPTQQASADTTTKITFETGASIRVTEPTGIRYIANLDESLLDLTGETVAFADGVTVGMLIVPSYTIENVSDDYISYLSTKYNKTEADFTTTFASSQIQCGEGGTYCVAGAITGITDTNYLSDYQAVAYYKQGNTINYSVKSDERSIAQVAEGVMYRGDYVENATALTTLGNIVEKAVMFEKGDALTLDVYENTYDLNSWFSSIQGEVTYAVTDTSIATVEDGVLTLKKGGKTTVTVSAYEGYFSYTINLEVKELLSTFDGSMKYVGELAGENHVWSLQVIYSISTELPKLFKTGEYVALRFKTLRTDGIDNHGVICTTSGTLGGNMWTDVASFKVSQANVWEEKIFVLGINSFDTYKTANEVYIYNQSEASLAYFTDMELLTADECEQAIDIASKIGNNGVFTYVGDYQNKTNVYAFTPGGLTYMDYTFFKGITRHYTTLKFKFWTNGTGRTAFYTDGGGSLNWNGDASFGATAETTGTWQEATINLGGAYLSATGTYCYIFCASENQTVYVTDFELVSIEEYAETLEFLPKLTGYNSVGDFEGKTDVYKMTNTLRGFDLNYVRTLKKYYQSITMMVYCTDNERMTFYTDGGGEFGWSSNASFATVAGQWVEVTLNFDASAITVSDETTYFYYNITDNGGNGTTIYFANARLNPRL